MLNRRQAASAAAFFMPAAWAQAESSERLQTLLARSLDGSRTPAVAAAVLRDGRVAGQAVQGLRRNDGADLVQLQDRWLIGSNAKALTATLIARLVEAGRLDWDRPLESALREARIRLHAAYRRVTLRQLLTHHSGLPENVKDLKFFETFHRDARALPEQRMAYLGRALGEAPLARPGTRFSYSNTGYLLAAVLAERALALPYEELLRREVLDPLGMDGVAYGVPPAGEPQGHSEGGPVTRPEQSNPLMFAPAGNLHLRLSDWAAFCVDQLAGARGQGRLLSAAGYATLQQPYKPGATAAMGWGRQAQLGTHPGPVLMHAGSDGNWYALVALFPEQGRGALVVCNAGPDMDGDKVATGVLKALL